MRKLLVLLLLFTASLACADEVEFIWHNPETFRLTGTIKSKTSYYFDADTFFTFNGSTVALLVNGVKMQSWFNPFELPGILLTEAGENYITEGGDTIQWELEN